VGPYSRPASPFLALALLAALQAPAPAAPNPGAAAAPVARAAPRAVLDLARWFPGGISPGLVWAVDAVPGGDARAGTVARAGAAIRYTAPAAAGAHLVSAAPAAGGAPVAWAAVLVGAVPDPPPGPAANGKEPPYLARGDAGGDDTYAIQRALDAVAGTGGTVLIPAGTYRINTVANANRGLVIGGSLTLRLAPGATLKAIPSASASSTILSVAGAADVAIQGGTLLGDRSAHPGAAGEWGMGLAIQGSRRVTVSGVTARDCWGDGFYVAGSGDVTFDAVLADHNRRNGLSVISCRTLTVRGSVFRNSQGTDPQDGLDIEPNSGDSVTGVLITGCLFADNAGNGLEDGVPDSNSGRAFITQVTVDGNASAGNGRGPAPSGDRVGIRISNCPGTLVTGNVVMANARMGIYLRNNADGSLVQGNTAAFNAGDGIAQASCRDNRIIANRVVGNAGHGISSSHCGGGTVSANTLAGNAMGP